jgi:hypothetical protein
MVSSIVSSRSREGFRRPSDQEDIVNRDRGQLGLLGEESQAHMAIIRSRQALIGCRTQLVNQGYEERSSP